MSHRNGLPWMGTAVGLLTASVGALWLVLGRLRGVEPGELAILGGLCLLSLVMAGRCRQAALALPRARAARCERCGTAHHGGPCPRRGAR